MKKKVIVVIGILFITILLAGCTVPRAATNTVIIKDIHVINNVRGQWGDFCPCKILADDGVVYTANSVSCVKLPIGMNATITADLDTAKWTGYRCAIYDATVRP